MPDNENMEQQGLLVDRGWDAMQRLLDEEMPVVAPEKSKKRRFLPFLLLFGLGVMLSLIWIIPSKPTTSIGAFPILMNGSGNNKQPHRLQQSPVAEQAAASNTEIIAFTDFRPATPPPGGDVNLPASTQPLPSRLQFLPLSAAPLKIEPLNPSQLDQGYFVGNFNALNNTVNSEEPGLIATLGTLPVQPLFPEHAEVDELTKIDKKHQRNLLRAHLGLEVGYINGDYFDQHGFTAGVVGQLRWHQSRWGIQSGIHYWRSSQTVDLATSYNTTDTLVYEGNIHVYDDDIFSTASLMDTVSRSVSLPFTATGSYRHEQIRIPLLVTYQLHPNWQLETGMEVAFTQVNSWFDRAFQNDDLALETVTDASFGNVGSVNRFDDEAFLSLPNEEVFHKFDFSSRIGLGYVFNKHLTFKASYHHGWRDVFKQAFPKTRQRHFQLAGQWWF